MNKINKTFFFISFIFFSNNLYAEPINVSSSSLKYACGIIKYENVENPLSMLGPADNKIAELGFSTVSYCILDMDSIIDHDGYDLIFYELWGAGLGPGNKPGIHLDNIQIDISKKYCIAGGSYSWTTIFSWGDNISDNNGNLPEEYFKNGETPNTQISARDLDVGYDMNNNSLFDSLDGSGIKISSVDRKPSHYIYIYINK